MTDDRETNLRNPLLWLILVAALTSCASVLPPPRPSQQLAISELILEENFTAIGDWDSYNLEGVTVSIENDAYHMQFDIEAYVWGQNQSVYEDVVIQVATLPNTDYDRNGYGVICRASPQNNGRGYYFLISSDGQYSIRRGMAGSVEPLVRWEYSDIIKRGQQRNIIRVACVANYLALYVNGQFVAEAFDDLYHQGAVGLTGVIAGDNGEFDLFFDDLRVWETSLR